MNPDSRAFVALDTGTATVSGALVGRIEGRWRLVGAAAAPVTVGAGPVLDRLGARLAAADPHAAAELGLPHDPRAAADAVAELPRLACRTGTAPRLVVLAASGRALAPLVAAAERAGWQVRGIALADASVLDVAAALADPAAATVLLGASDPPGADERTLLPELATLVAAAAERRPGLHIVLAGGLAEPGGRTEQLLGSDRPGGILLAPAAHAGEPTGEPLRELLDVHRADPDDARRALARSVRTLADVLERRVEVVEIGQGGGARAAAAPAPAGATARGLAASVSAAALVPAAVDDASVDAVGAWITIPVDRLRLRDRLRELVLHPWADPAGDGAIIRLAAARAALERLVAATPAFAAVPAPDLLIATGGAFAVAPGPAVALALADTVRRPGATGLGLDHARLLAPLGLIEDEAERRALVADLREDLVAPLGTAIIAAGLRTGRSAGRLTVHGPGAPHELDLVPGGLDLVDLPPGERAVVELRFRDAVDVGTRARHVAVEVGGGLGGLLVDLRDIPLSLPDRPERRRDLLAAWQAALWSGVDR